MRHITREHENFMLSSMKQGDVTALRTGRDVVCVHKDGSMMPVHLTHSFKRDGPKHIFTTIFQQM
jgi:hypothetical protein